MANIGIIGAGEIGANIGFLILEQNIATVTLFDKQEGLGTGKALDIMEAAPLQGYSYGISGTEKLKDLEKCSVIVLASGTPVLPDISVKNVLEENISIIKEYAETLRTYTGIVLIAIEPSEILTTMFIEYSGLPKNRVLSLGSTVDSLRLEYMIAEFLSLHPENVAATVIGGHGTLAVPLQRYTTVSGMPLEYFLRQNEIEHIHKKLTESDEQIANLLSKTGAYYAPAAATVNILRAIVCDTYSMLTVGTFLDGPYNVKNQVMNVPSIISSSGIHDIIELELDKEEQASFKKAENTIQEIVAGVRK